MGKTMELLLIARRAQRKGRGKSCKALNEKASRCLERYGSSCEDISNLLCMLRHMCPRIKAETLCKSGRIGVC